LYRSLINNKLIVNLEQLKIIIDLMLQYITKLESCKDIV
jgi:hypothetical protein